MTIAVNIWRLSLGTIPDRLCHNLLSPTEKAKAAGFHKTDDQARSREARTALRLILGQHLARPPASLIIKQPVGERPRLAGSTVDTQPSFTVSHSGSQIIIAVANCPVGVDVEQEREDDWLTIADQFFHADEITWLTNSEEATRQEQFFRLWTLKEAYLKGLGRGLDRMLNSFCICPSVSDSATLKDPLNQTPWQLQTLNTVPGYAAAIAIGSSIEAPNPAAREAAMTQQMTTELAIRNQMITNKTIIERDITELLDQAPSVK